MPTIRDVAKVANVSIGTVSRYLNGYNIKEENRIKIESAIQQLNFRSNPIARGLRTNKSHSVGVLIPRITDIFCTQVIEGIEEVLNPFNYSIFVCSSNDDLEQQTEKLRFLINKMVDGIILMPVTSAALPLDDIVKSEIPIVLVDRLVKGQELDAVVCDNVNGAYSAVEMIINRGHRKIGIIAGPEEIFTAYERLEGYKRALADYNIKLDERYIAFAEYKKDGGIDAFQYLISLDDPPTAIFTTNYPTTVNSMKVMMEKGLRMGQDISLFGYDQTELFQMFHPPVSVVVQPTYEIGKNAAQILYRRMNGDRTDFPRVLRLKTHIIETDSVKRLR